MKEIPIYIMKEMQILVISPYEDVILEVGEQKNLLITIGANGPGRGDCGSNISIGTTEL